LKISAKIKHLFKCPNPILKLESTLKKILF